MSYLTYLPNQPEQVLDALRLGEITSIDVAVEQVPDFFLLYAIESGLLDGLANSFPDPRDQPEIDLRVLLAAGMAGHFAGLYALSQSPYALHSPTLLSALGVQVAVNQPGEGLSRRGTKQETSFHGDVLRKLLGQVARRDEKACVLPGQTLLDWYNAHAGALFLKTIDAAPLVHILDCTELHVPLANERYELSGVTTRHESGPKRGYKLATLRSLLDEGAVITSLGWSSIEQHDVTLAHDLIRTTSHLRAGDILVQDRGFLDAADINYLKQERGVDVFTGLKSDMLLLRSAIAEANSRPGDWRAHPTRPDQQIQLIEGKSGIWEGLKVPMNVCVVRAPDPKTQQKTQQKTQEWRFFGFATTDLAVNAKQVICTYQIRPEIEEDYRQLKSEAWHVDRFCTTRLVQIIWHVLLTLLAYNLFQVYANTKSGRSFAGKTKQRIEREQARNPTSRMLVCTRTAYGVFDTKALLPVLLRLPDKVRNHICTLLDRPAG